MWIDREKLAWAAGFFDGEGCFSALTHPHENRDGTHHRTPRACVSQAEAPVLLWKFRDAVRVGSVRGPYNHSKPGKVRKPTYVYMADGFERTQAVICLLWPWLGVVKRLDGIEVLKQYHAHLGRPGQEPNQGFRLKGRRRGTRVFLSTRQDKLAGF